MSAEVVVVGNALAGLVAAAELDRAGHEVTLVKPGGPWGGYFAGLQVDGLMFDAGMVMLEFTAFAPQAGPEALAGYDPAIRNDVGRFAGVVRDWAHARFATREVAAPLMRLEGETLPDLIMGNALEALARLPFADAALADLTSMPAAGPLHASQKAQGAAYEDASFEAASRANHGDALHDRLMAPFLAKVFGQHAGQLLARYHRIPWLPLYWPETLRTVLEGAEPPFAPSPLEYPLKSTVAEVVAGLTASLQASPRVRMLNGEPVRLTPAERGGVLDLADGSRLPARRLAWAHSPAALIQALGGTAWSAPLPRAPLALALLTVPRPAAVSPFSVLQVIEPAFSLYRVTDLTECAGSPDAERRWVVEFNTEVFKARHGDQASDEAILGLVAQELQDLGLVASAQAVSCRGLKLVPGGFAVPDRAALEAWSRDRATIDGLAPGIDLMAAGSGFMVTSLSDQVVQGLKLAQSVQAAPGT